MVAAIEMHDDDHPVILAGAWPANTAKAGPSIVERTDQNFLAATLGELAGASPSDVVANHRPGAANGALKLFQPVHRTFYLALLETHCDVFMSPRLDPKKIDSAGLVVRRQAVDTNGQAVLQGWCTANNQVQGWVNLTTAEMEIRDPDPKKRPVTRLTADPRFDLSFRGPPDPTAEDFSRMFVAPANTAEATSRTLIYGMIPVTSTARAGEPAPAEDQPNQADWSAHLLSPLKASTSETSLGLPAGTLSDQDIVNFGDSLFVKLVLQLRQEFGLFRDDAPARAALAIAYLNQLTLTLQDGSTANAGDYLTSAARVLVDRDLSNAPSRPNNWPVVSDALANNLYSVLRPLAEDVRKALVAPDGSAGRFDKLTARYVIRAFIRVKRSGGCPPRIIWSEYSEPFAIAPWYDNGPAAPIQIALPDPFDKNFLKAAKPGVAFSVPEKLANFLNTDGNTLLKGGQGGGLTLDWICGFNIPLITICAFIVLSLFLSLFNLIFFWLPFVKICIPFPRPK